MTNLLHQLLIANQLIKIANNNASQWYDNIIPILKTYEKKNNILWLCHLKQPIV